MRKGGLGSFHNVTQSALAATIGASMAHLSETGKESVTVDMLRQYEAQLGAKDIAIDARRMFDPKLARLHSERTQLQAEMDALVASASADALRAQLAHVPDELRRAAQNDLAAQIRERLDAGEKNPARLLSAIEKIRHLSQAQTRAILDRVLEKFGDVDGSKSPAKLALAISTRLKDLPAEEAKDVLESVLRKVEQEQASDPLGKSYRGSMTKIGEGEMKIPPELGNALDGLTTRQRAETLELVGAKYGLGSRRSSSQSERQQFASDVHAVAEVVRMSNAQLVPICNAAMPTFARLAREWTAPPGKPKTPANFELLAMNVIRATLAVERESRIRFGDAWKNDSEDQTKEWLTVQHLAAERNDGYRRLLDELADFWREFDDCPGFGAFAEAWIAAAFARLEIGHKLAASLCLTDVPEDIEVRAPWNAWSLVIPDGLFGGHLHMLHDDGSVAAPLARVWCMGAEARFGISANGHFGLIDKRDGVAWQMLDSLVRGACLALSNPEEFSKERVGPNRPHGSKGDKRKGPPDLQQARFLLAAPVKVDFRQHVLDAIAGTGPRKGASPTVQFLVRGHWRNQTHGPRNSLRKQKWIPAFFKGPEDTRVLLRSHKVEGE